MLNEMVGSEDVHQISKAGKAHWKQELKVWKWEREIVK